MRGAVAIGIGVMLGMVACTTTEQRAGSTVAPAAMNPLLAEWQGPFGGVPPWDSVTHQLFPEAFQNGIDELLAQVEAVAADPAAQVGVVAGDPHRQQHLGAGEPLGERRAARQLALEDRLGVAPLPGAGAHEVLDRPAVRL